MKIRKVMQSFETPSCALRSMTPNNGRWLEQKTDVIAIDQLHQTLSTSWQKTFASGNNKEGQ